MTQHSSDRAAASGAPQPTGWIRLTLQRSRFNAGTLTPTVRLNGQPVPAGHGENLYPVVPGRWRVEVETRWSRGSYGQAALDLSVREDEAVPVYYAQPHHQRAPGSIGLAPQRRAGVGGLVAMLVLLGVCVLMLVLAVALVTLSLSRG